MSEETNLLDGDLVTKQVIEYSNANGELELRLEIAKGEFIHHQKRRGETMIHTEFHTFTIDIPIDLAILQYEYQTKGE